MKIQRLIEMMVMSGVMASCGVVGEGRHDYAPMSPVAERSGDGAVQRKLIKSGEMRVVTAHVTEASKLAEQVVKQQGGRIEDKSEGEDVHYDIRVPATKLEVTMKAFEGLGTVKYQKVWVKDVTDEYIDVEAKLKNMRTLRDRLRVLYKKAEKVEDMLKIEKELARVQGELDSMEGRMNVMKRDVAYSKIDLNIERRKIPGPLGAVGKSIAWVGKKLWVVN